MTDIANIIPIDRPPLQIHQHAGESPDKSRFYIWTTQGYQCSVRSSVAPAAGVAWQGTVEKYVKTEKEAQRFLRESEETS